MVITESVRKIFKPPMHKIQ